MTAARLATVVTGWVVVLAATLSIVGVVGVDAVAAQESATVDGTVTDVGGDPIANATVRAGERETETDADGRFEFDVTFEGQGIETLVASHEAYESDWVQVRENDPDSRSVSLTLSLDEDAPVNQNGTITATLTDETDESVANATIALTAENASNGTEFATTTGADGDFVLDAPPGTYAFVASADGYLDVTRNVTIDPNYRRIIHLDAMREASRVAGSVTETGGDPIANATVTAAGTSDESLTNSTGAYSISVPPGQVRVVAEADGFDRASESVVVGESEAVERDLVLDAAEADENEDEGGEDDPPGDESNESDDGNETSEGAEPPGETGDGTDTDGTADGERDAEARNLPGYWQSMTLIGVFASVLLAMATVAVVRS